MNSDTPAQSVTVCQWFYDAVINILESGNGDFYIEGNSAFLVKMKEYLDALHKRNAATSMEEREKLTEELDYIRGMLETRWYNT